MTRGFRERQIAALQSEERMMPLYRIIAYAMEALENCKRHDNKLWEDHWSLLVDMGVGLLPHGGGFDDYPKLTREVAKQDYLVFHGSYHEMNSHGFYVGWRDYRVVVKPSFVHGLTVRVTGAGKALGEYIHEVFHSALVTEYDVNKLRVVILMRETNDDDAVDNLPAA